MIFGKFCSKASPTNPEIHRQLFVLIVRALSVVEIVPKQIKTQNALTKEMKIHSLEGEFYS